MIRLEHEKIAVGGSREKLEGCESMRLRYHHERDLAKEMQTGAHTGAMELTPQKTNDPVTSLYKLPLNGQTFQDHVSAAIRSHRQRDHDREQNCMPAASASTGHSRRRDTLQDNVAASFRRDREPSLRDDCENDGKAPTCPWNR